MQIIDSVITTLQIAKLATADIHVPGLNTALESALSIAKKARDIRDTRDDCRALSERAVHFTLAVCEQLKGSLGGCDTETKEHVTTLLQNLQDIENLMDRRLRAGKRERILFAFKHGKIAKEVKNLTAKLEDSYRIFMIQAAVVIDQNMNTLTSGNIRIMQHIDDSARAGDVVLGETRVIRTDISDLANRVRGCAMFDGNFRVFSRENLALLEPIVESHTTNMRHEGEHTLVRAVAQPRTGRVFRYRAVVQVAGNLTGTRVVVCAYSNRDKEWFVKSVEFAKQTCHPHILAMLGYSRPGSSGEAAYIVTEDYLPFVEYLNRLRGANKLRALLRMSAAICMAVEHLEMIEMRRMLPEYRFWGSTTFHTFGLAELVFDHRHGGRIKWDGDSLTPEEMSRDPRKEIDVPTAQESRMRLVADICAIACGCLDSMVQCWLSQILSSVALYYYFFVPDRLWWRSWERVLDRPRFPLGVWLGGISRHEGWTVLHATQNTGFELATTVEMLPLVLPSPNQNSCDFDQRFSRADWFNVPTSDNGEMCVDIDLNLGAVQTRWKRYQFTRISVNTTLLFLQSVHALDGPDAASWMMRSLPDSNAIGSTRIGIAIERRYFTETVVTASANAAEQEALPLWFFLPEFGGSDGYTHQCAISCGFWSLEKYPASVPEDILFDSTSQFESVGENLKAPLFTSTQVLGALVFTTRTKMSTEIIELTGDELLAFQELQENHHSANDANFASDSNDFATHGNSDENTSTTGDFNTAAVSLESGDNSNAHTSIACSKSTDESDYQDTTDTESSGTDAYHSAEEYEVTGWGEGSS